MSDRGISSYGAYIPRLRIERASIAKAHEWAAPSLKSAAKGSRAFASWDEDAITMAAEAARGALAHCDCEVAQLTLASTHLPYADLQNAAVVAKAVGLPGALSTLDVSGSQRAGTSALLRAFGASGTHMVIGSDAPRAKPGSLQEMGFGAGAAAFVISEENVAAQLLGSASITDVFVDHFRGSDQDSDYLWEERWIRDVGYAQLVPAAVADALSHAQLSISDIQHLVMPSYLRGSAEAVAKRLKFGGVVASGLDDGVGYTGAAHSLLMLAATLENANPGERILVVGFGQGVDALILETTAHLGSARPKRGVGALLHDSLSTQSYLRMLSFHGGIEMDWGMRSEKNAKTALTEQYRSADQIEGFVAGKCNSCGTVQFPQLQYCARCRAGREQFEQVTLRDEPAVVLTSTADWLSYHPAPPLHVGFVQFDNGARVLMEIVDVGETALEKGTPVRMVYRIKERDRQRAYNRYFWKATPVAVG